MKAEKEKRWAHAIADFARLVTNTFLVLIHSIMVKSVACATDKEMHKSIKLIHDENKKLHPGLEVIRISWSIKARNKGKKLSLLRLKVLTLEKANEILDRGLLVDYMRKDTELFEPGCHIVRCHQCQEYGHTSHICKKAQKCANALAARYTKGKPCDACCVGESGLEMNRAATVTKCGRNWV